MSTAFLRKVFERERPGDPIAHPKFMIHNPVWCSYSFMVPINKSVLHLSTVGKYVNDEKNQGMNDARTESWELLMNNIFCTVSSSLLYTLCRVF
jgi:hypothetical protein